MSIPYEQLIQDLHQALLQNDGVDNVQVLHNVRIKGKSRATHQIDVYWEFRLAGVTYKTCIECKHYNSSVKKSHIAAFSAVLEDIGNATGIFTTTVGYQEGALLFAQSKGIRLLVVNPLLKSVNITLNIAAPSTTITGIKYNQQQISKRLSELGIESHSFYPSWQQETVFYDKDGNVTTTLKNIFHGKAIEDGNFSLDTPEIYDKTEIGLIEIETINYSIRTYHDKREIVVDTNNIERAIMEDVFENISYYLNDDGSVSKIEQP